MIGYVVEGSMSRVSEKSLHVLKSKFSMAEKVTTFLLVLVLMSGALAGWKHVT